MAQYKHYISRLVGDVWEKEVSIEDAYEGLVYIECKGLSDYGKVKNVYTESFPETDELQAYIPETPVRENTNIELTLLFKGAKRRDVFDSFVEYITGKEIKYWDTCRNREVTMILNDKIELGDDYLKGDEPYMVATFKFINKNGQSKKKV